jgi:transcriptional regulator NrdR family protein
MHCLKCQSKARVIYKRKSSLGVYSRRYKCVDCGFRFNTYEGATIPKPDMMLRDLKLVKNQIIDLIEIIESIYR